MDKRSQYMSDDSNKDRSAYGKGNVGTGSPVVFSAAYTTPPTKETAPSANNDQSAQKATNESANQEQSTDGAGKYPKKSILEIDVKNTASPTGTDCFPAAAKIPAAAEEAPATPSSSGDQSPKSGDKVKKLIDFYENKSSPSSSPNVKRTGKSWSPKSSTTTSTTPISSKNTESEKSPASSQSVEKDDAKKTSAESNSPIVSPKDKKDEATQSNSASPTSDLKVTILADNKQQEKTTEQPESSNKSGGDRLPNVTGKSSNNDDQSLAYKNIAILFLAVLILILLTFAICAK